MSLKYKFYLCHLSDMLHMMIRAMNFSKVDVNVYHKVSMRESNERNNIFKIKNGLDKWIIMPLGLSKAQVLSWNNEVYLLAFLLENPLFILKIWFIARLKMTFHNIRKVMGFCKLTNYIWVKKSLFCDSDYDIYLSMHSTITWQNYIVICINVCLYATS